MDNDKFIKYVSNELVNGKDVEIESMLNGVPYKIMFLAIDSDNGINIPSILAIPLSNEVNNQIIVEANNLESEDSKKILEQGIQTGYRLACLTRDLPAPIIIPLIPSHKNYPYLQQLSAECFDIPKGDKNYRIDEQVVRIINKSKAILKNEVGLTASDKIFLNGYSSSGVFAQRFALLHPDVVETACVGGASGSIPVPTKDLSYPLGIADYEQLTGKEFDFENYSKIKFRYYVGELETQNKSNTRVDDFGNLAAMHDMSYFNRSVPVVVGKKQREIFGKDMFFRAERTIQVLKSLGIDIQHEIILGRGHNNIDGIGVNELGDKIINDTYKNTIADRELEDNISR